MTHARKAQASEGKRFQEGRTVTDLNMPDSRPTFDTYNNKLWCSFFIVCDAFKHATIPKAVVYALPVSDNILK